MQEMVTAACPRRHRRSAVRRQLALDPDRRHLHPALDPELDPRAVLARPDDQRHDAGRPGAGRRHPGRRRHRDDREHQHAPGRGGADGKHKGLEQAIIDAANQIVVPTFVSTLCICIVWLPLFQLGGVAGYLFLPLAEAIIFAMIASFILSRTLTPTMAAWLLRGQVAAQHRPAPRHVQASSRASRRGSRRASSGSATRYRAMLEAARRAPQAVRAALSRAARWRRFCCCSSSDRISSRASNRARSTCTCASPVGTRIEETAKIAVLVEQQIRDLLPGHVIGTLVNCGLPVSGINQAYSNTGTVGSQDCDITISLDNQASPVDRYRQILRAGLTERFPGTRVQLPAGRHHGEDPELRPALADRRPGQRPRSRHQLRLCHAS